MAGRHIWCECGREAGLSRGQPDGVRKVGHASCRKSIKNANVTETGKEGVGVRFEFVLGVVSSCRGFKSSCPPAASRFH